MVREFLAELVEVDPALELALGIRSLRDAVWEQGGELFDVLGREVRRVELELVHGRKNE